MELKIIRKPVIYKINEFGIINFFNFENLYMA